MPNRRKTLEHLAGLAALSALPHRAWAQSDYPSKQIRYVVPFPGGGLVDVMARLIGQKVSESLRQPVLVENKPGAGANIGAEFVAKSAPDGHTWLAITLTHAVNQSLFPSLPYNLERDLTPVAQLATSPLALVVPADGPIRNLREFLALARARAQRRFLRQRFAAASGAGAAGAQRQGQSPARALQGWHALDQ